ncbi:U3 snoRNP protein [Polyrhizophydium stewartii]|uniref:U3 snoRNP protein n=1 Tax=Polyrhizophydium stewartii TaxID=2732419 RepID=A0ABR4NJR1_9FUNG
MKLDFKFSNLCGTVYKKGNVLFTPDGNSLVSPVGNRVSVFDLVKCGIRLCRGSVPAALPPALRLQADAPLVDGVASFSFTMPFDAVRFELGSSSRPSLRIALSVPDELVPGLDLSVDGKVSSGIVSLLPLEGQLGNKHVVLHHHNFKAPVRDLAFSPDGRFLAVTHGKQIHIWNAPGFTLEFAPFVLHRVLTGHYDDVSSVSWSPDSRFLLSASRDMSCRVYALNHAEHFEGAVLTGHNDVVVGAWFAKNGTSIFTVGRDGALFEWTRHSGSWLLPDGSSAPDASARAGSASDADAADADEDEDGAAGPDAQRAKRRKPAATAVAGAERPRIKHWKSTHRHYFNQNHAKVVSATFHAASGLLSVGFDSGIFGIWELPDFTNIHTLSISQKKINTVAVNASGEWLAFGSSKLGQLLVWEWQSESYVLKQQGHQHDMNCIAYSPDGQFIATGGDDGKVKLWNTQTGFCFVTFAEHSGSIVAVEFARRGQVVFSASIDGTVRAFDLVRYRNFRTFTSPTPVQFSALAVEPSGELVCAGSMDSFEIYVWSVQTGRLLDILPGHEGPISGLCFSPLDGVLASSSWDKTVRVWNIFARDKQSEMLDHQSEVLALAYTPDGRHIAASTLNGQICIWNMDLAKQESAIEGRKDIAGGRSSTDRTTAANASGDKHFTSICFTADGSGIIAGGNSKYVCIYDVASLALLKRFQISHNLSLDGMLEMLNSKNMTEAGPMDLIDQSAELSDLEDRLDRSLPGVQSGDKSLRQTRPQARTKGVRFAPTGRSWAAASTEGLLVYSLDDRIVFDPFDLEMDITPDAVRETLAAQDYTRALVMALRLGEQPPVQAVYMATPTRDVPLVVRGIPTKYLDRLMRFLVVFMDASPRLEFHLEWCTAVAKFHGRYLHDHASVFAAPLRALAKALAKAIDDLGAVCAGNKYLAAYLVDRCDQAIARANAEAADAADADAAANGGVNGVNGHVGDAAVMDIDQVDMAAMGL